jgi:T5SS/PEP-CTERM-associated repeat protein
MLAAWQPAVVAAETLAIAAGAQLQSSGLIQLGPAAVTRIDSGGQVVVGGLTSGVAVAVEGTLLVNGGRIAAGPKQAGASATGGTVTIGLGDGPRAAVMTVQAGSQVSDTGTMLGAGPVSSGTLVLTGAGTSWSDLTDPTRQNTTGTMLLGVQDPGVGVGSLAAAPATLLVSQGAVLTDSGYAEIGVAPGSSAAAIISGGARWQVGAGALVVGAGGSGTLSILNGGTVTAGSGGTFLAGGTALAMPFGIEAGQSGAGTITVNGKGSALITSGALVLGGGGLGTLAVSAGGFAEAGGLQVWQGSVAGVDPLSAIDVGNSGTVVAGAVLIESGRTMLGDGLIAANVVNNGTVLATPAAAGAPVATLEIGGNLSGTGTIARAGGASAEIDGSIGAGQTIMFSPGGGQLRLVALFSNLATPLVGLGTGDKISSPQWTQILSAQAVGPHSVVVQTKTGTVVLSNLSFAPGASGAFTWYKDPASGNWTIEVAPPVMDWNAGPRGGALGSAGNWISEQTGLPPGAPRA